MDLRSSKVCKHLTYPDVFLDSAISNITVHDIQHCIANAADFSINHCIAYTYNNTRYHKSKGYHKWHWRLVIGHQDGTAENQRLVAQLSPGLKSSFQQNIHNGSNEIFAAAASYFKNCK
jgi:hypothetical protein